MADPFTIEENTSAAQLGWQVCPVYDTALSSWSYKALPTAFTKACPHVPALVSTLIRAAKNGDKLALRALQVAAQPGFMKQKVKKK